MKLSKSQQTVLIIISGFLALYFIYKWIGFTFIACGLLIISFLSPFLTRKIHWVWMKLGGILGYINSKVILTIIFFLVLTPLALLRKFFKKVSTHNGTDTESLFEDRNHLYNKDDLRNVW